MQAHRAVIPVKGQHYQAGDDRWQRERQIDDGVDQPFAYEIVPY